MTDGYHRLNRLLSVGASVDEPILPLVDGRWIERSCVWGGSSTPDARRKASTPPRVRSKARGSPRLLISRLLVAAHLPHGWHALLAPVCKIALRFGEVRIDEKCEKIVFAF